jgi:hypothetical protein
MFDLKLNNLNASNPRQLSKFEKSPGSEKIALYSIAAFGYPTGPRGSLRLIFETFREFCSAWFVSFRVDSC